MPPRLFLHSVRALVFGVGAFFPAGCNSGTGPSNSTGNITVEVEMDHEIGILSDSTSDSLGIGFTVHSPLFNVHSADDSRIRKDGVFLVAFPDHKPDSVDVLYYKAGSQAAWAPHVSLQDSLDAELLDSAGYGRYLEASNQHYIEYFVQKSLPESACSFSAPNGTARVQSGDVGLDVPIIFASIRRNHDGGHILTIDQEASRPPGAASVNLVGKTYTGTLILSCSVPL